MVKWGSIVSKPDWLDEIRKFAKNPDAYIIRIISVWIVGGLLAAGATLVGAVQTAFEPVIGLMGTIAGAFEAAFTPVADLIVWIVQLPTTVLFDATQGLGPLQPFIIVPAYFLWIGAVVYGLSVALGVVFPRARLFIEDVIP